MSSKSQDPIPFPSSVMDMDRSLSYDESNPSPSSMDVIQPASTPTHASVVPQDPRLASLIARGVFLRQRLLFIKQEPSRITPELLDELAMQLNEIMSEAHEMGEGVEKEGRMAESVESAAVLLGFCWLSLNERHRVGAVMVQFIALQFYLDRAEKTNAYTLDEIKSALDYLEDEMKLVKWNDNVALEMLLKNTESECRARLERLKHRASTIPPELRSTHALLVRLRRDLVMRQVLLNLGTTPLTDDAMTVSKLRLRLQELDSRRVNGKFPLKQRMDPKEVTEDVSRGDREDSPDPGQEWLAQLMDSCQADLQRITSVRRAKTSPSPNSLSATLPSGVIDFGAATGIVHELVAVKHDLERCLLTRRWTFRETDLWEPWVRMSKCTAKINTSHENESNSPATVVGLEMCQFLAWKCRGLILRLLRPDAAQARVAPELVATRNQLLTLRRCLEELKRLGGDFTDRELYLYQMKLSHVDNQRVDGKFVVADGGIPEGQAAVVEILEECYELLEDLRGNNDKHQDEGKSAS